MKSKLLGDIISIAKSSGDLILEYYNDESYSIEYKSDESPVTAADIASNSYIVSELEKTNMPVVSEETECDLLTRKSWTEFWLVDPLDGTKDFISRNGEFTVNIALIEGGVPTLGVIYAPAIDTLYYARKGEGAYKEENGTVTRLPVARPGRCIVTVSRQHLSVTGKKFIEMNGITDAEQRGSSLKFGVLAEGKATVYPRFEGSMEWDIAAGHIIATEAGCGIIDLKTGKEPEYNKDTLFNNPFIAFAPDVKIDDLKIPDS